MTTNNCLPGVSGLSLYVPRPRVRLSDWCEWSGSPADKVEAVVGRSFRVCAPGESVYTMAANAALRLIDAYDVDPTEVGFLGFGTESSTDNAAGAVVIKGMLDDALVSRGMPILSRSCEVPEVKHACLGGVYAMKAAARYLASDGRGRKAIVVSADIAEYERGSSGEQTQGAGAVAMLLESRPRMFEIDLAQSGSASSYRGVDFRKPFARHFMDGYATSTKRMHDFPVFNGKYSTMCYIDAVVHALDDMFERNGRGRGQFFDEVAAVTCHRPYQHMPVQAMAAALVWGMGRDPSQHDRLRVLCAEGGLDFERVLGQLIQSPDLFERLLREGPDSDPFPDALAAVRTFRSSGTFRSFVRDKMSLGSELVRDLGNLYTAALPAWIAAAFEDALGRGDDLTGRSVLAIGYGSGDAAEAIPLRATDGWQTAAAKIGVARALQDAVDLTREQYEALHDGRPVQLASHASPGTFVVEKVGERNDAAFQDIGIEYYAYVS
jgi:hydroxymethylglutaryl-CoA synthase